METVAFILGLLILILSGAVLFTVIPILALIGLIKPNTFSSILKKHATRPRIFATLSASSIGVIVVSLVSMLMIGYGSTDERFASFRAPESQKEKQSQEVAKKTPEPPKAPKTVKETKKVAKPKSQPKPKKVAKKQTNTAEQAPNRTTVSLAPTQSYSRPKPKPQPRRQSSSSGVVKKSNSGICHAPGTTYYARTKNFIAYNSLNACLNSGGRMPLR